MNDESTDQEEALVKFAAAMDAIGVEYMVTGSTALNFLCATPADSRYRCGDRTTPRRTEVDR
jgi:hypothetical protein